MIRVLVGYINVDAGLVWIGDPCYILHKTKKELPKTLGKDWYGFCDKLSENSSNPYHSFKHHEDNTRDGLGICVRSGYGDGTYPVYAELDNGVVRKVWVDFFCDEDDE